MAKKKAPKTRLSLDVSPRVRAKLEKLVAESDADSMTEVFRRALAYYEYLLKCGGTVVIKKEDGSEESLVIT